MRISVHIPADQLDAEFQYVAPHGLTLANLHERIGEGVPVRIGDMAHAATLVGVEVVEGGGRVVTLDLIDSDLRWEALVARPVNTSR